MIAGEVTGTGMEDVGLQGVFTLVERGEEIAVRGEGKKNRLVQLGINESGSEGRGRRKGNILSTVDLTPTDLGATERSLSTPYILNWWSGVS